MSPRFRFCLAPVVLGSLLGAGQAWAEGGKRDENRILPPGQSNRERGVKSREVKRVEALAFAKNVLNAIDVIQEDYVHEFNQGNLVALAIRELYRHIEEIVPRTIRVRLTNARALQREQLLQLLIDAREAIGAREDLDNLKDLSITLQRLFRRLDPYTTYTDPEARAPWGCCGSVLVGIGIRLVKDPATDQLRVVTPIKGSPAHKAKLMAGDLVASLIREMDSNGNPIAPPELVPTRGLSVNKANKIIMGSIDTRVKLVIQRKGVRKPFTVEITRKPIEEESVLGAKRKANDDWDFMIDARYKIGYLHLSCFARNSFRDIDAAMKDLMRQGVKGFVLDLRFNPGGLLDVAIKVADLYVDDGLIFSIRPRWGGGREYRFDGKHEGSLLDFPMVCLVNGGSASGSEIVAAALQDRWRAWIIGERTFGKGCVQNVADLDVVDAKTGDVKRAEIALTTALFCRPSGKNLDRANTTVRDEWGVIPDKVIPLTAKERGALADHLRGLEIIRRRDHRAKAFTDRQLDAALTHLRGVLRASNRSKSARPG